MIGPTSTPVPGDHPDHDLLADLAAEVLPHDLATTVQDHVMGCHACASLLAEAEGIRSLLRPGQPETMPDEVLRRLERALVAARADGPSAGGERTATDSGTVPLPTRSDRSRPGRAESGRDPSDTSTRLIRPVAPATGSTRRISRSTPAGAEATGSVPASVGSRLSRMSRPSQSARRQAREEEKADRFARFGPLLKVAAVLVVAVGVGGLGWSLFQGVTGGADDSADSTAAGPAQGQAPLIAQVQSSGTNYSKDAMPGQVRSLLAAETTADRGSGLERATDGATPKASQRSQLSAAGGGQQLLRSPAALRACLGAIGAGGVQPVAVDLATYDGREAALIVLPADGGGYDVWVVARDCRPGADGTIDVVTVQP